MLEAGGVMDVVPPLAPEGSDLDRPVNVDCSHASCSGENGGGSSGGAEGAVIMRNSCLSCSIELSIKIPDRTKSWLTNRLL